MKKKWIYWLLSAALVACVYLVVDRTRERTVGQVCPELKEATACTLITVTVNDDSGTKTLEGEELDAFVDYFSQIPCRRDNKGDGTYEGQLYLLAISDKDGKPVSIQLTDQGYMEIEDKAYSFKPEEICRYLDSVLAA